MDSQRFITCIRRLYFLQGLTVTFNKDGISGLRRIYGLSRSPGGPKISDHSIGATVAVLETNDWCQDRNRNVFIHNMHHVDDATLTNIAKDVEKIEAENHWASGLMTGRKKRQEEVTQQLIADVLNENIIEEVSSWGASIEGHFAEIDGLPAIEFAIRNRETCETLVVVAIDGWSGRYSINGEWGDRRFSDAQGVRERIYSTLTDALDQATAA